MHHQPPLPSSSSVLLRLMWYMANIYYQCTTIYLIHSALCTKDRKIEMAMMMVCMVHTLVHCHLSLDDSRILPFCSSILFNNFIDSTNIYTTCTTNRNGNGGIYRSDFFHSRVIRFWCDDSEQLGLSHFFFCFLLRHIDRSMLLSFTFSLFWLFLLSEFPTWPLT